MFTNSNDYTQTDFKLKETSEKLGFTTLSRLIQGVSKGQVNPFGGESGPYLEQKFLIHFFLIRPHFRVTRT